VSEPSYALADRRPNTAADLRRELAALEQGSAAYYTKLRELDALEHTAPAPGPPIIASHRYRIDDDQGSTVAHVEIRDDAGVLWLTNLWVQGSKRGQGWAAALLARAVGEWQAHDLYLQVAPYTDQPIDVPRLTVFYGSFGFAPTTVPGVMHRPARPWTGRAPKGEAGDA